MWRRLERGARRKRGTLVRGRAVREYLAHHAVRKLQIGCGHNRLPGWLNTDCDPDARAVYLDAAKPLPFEDAVFDYVFSEHLIEHLALQEGQALLHECRRVLKRGGRIRIATPDLEKILQLKGPVGGGVGEEYVRWITEGYFPSVDAARPAYAINQLFRGWGHRFIYDEETLRVALERAGFARVRQCTFGHSEDPALRGIEGHGGNGGSKMSEFETMILEAENP